jgi:dienelactone hydrolase
MARVRADLKSAALALIGILALCHTAHAAEHVQFESARYQVGPLQRRLALERHEPIIPTAPDIIDGFLTKPDGPGPFPAIVHLHGCGGLPDEVKRGTNSLASDRLAAWGYVTLVVDSFTTRGINNTCSGEPAPRVADAYGALAWLARQPFVDANRIAVLGFSAGGVATMSIAEARDFELFENEDEHAFKAAVALYPACRSDNALKMPTLILIGELDDWTLAGECRNMVDGRDDWGISRHKGEGVPVRLLVYPDAYHAFDVPSLKTSMQYFGHHLEFNQAATDRSIDAVREFLDTTIGASAQAKGPSSK